MARPLEPEELRKDALLWALDASKIGRSRSAADRERDVFWLCDETAQWYYDLPPDRAMKAAELAGVPWDDHQFQDDLEYKALLGRAWIEKVGGNDQYSAAADLELHIVPMPHLNWPDDHGVVGRNEAERRSYFERHRRTPRWRITKTGPYKRRPGYSVEQKETLVLHAYLLLCIFLTQHWDLAKIAGINLVKRGWPAWQVARIQDYRERHGGRWSDEMPSSDEQERIATAANSLLRARPDC